MQLLNSFILKVSPAGTYPEVMANVYVDSFGTQIVEVEHEALDGRRSVLASTNNDEGMHMGKRSIQIWASMQGVL